MDQRQIKIEERLRMLNSRTIRQDRSIKEERELSQEALITYSVVILLLLSLITFAILLFASYVFSNATVETIFVQRIAPNLLRVLRMSTEAIRTELPSYSSINLTQME